MNIGLLNREDLERGRERGIEGENKEETEREETRRRGCRERWNRWKRETLR